MSHLSIAILRRNISSEKDPKFEYLVQFTTEGEHMFFDVRAIAINGGFDYSKLTRSFLEYFEFYNHTKSKDIDTSPYFKESDTNLFAQSRSEPYATSYIFTLGKILDDHITSSIKDKKTEEKWKYLKWVPQKDISKLVSTWKQDQRFIFEGQEPFEVPKFSNDLRAGLRNIVKAKEQGRLVIFAGAGVSVDSLLPSWRELTKGLSDDLDEIEGDDLKLAQLYFDTRGNKEFQERVQELLKFGKTTYNPIHESVVNISPLHIITTNFDDHFEQIRHESEFPYSMVKFDSDLPYSKGTSLYIKMHGDLESRNIVLKEEDYDYEKKFPLIDGFVKGIFASKMVLFIGFSNNDPNLNRIQSWVRNILKKDGQRPYIVFDEIDSSRKNTLENKNNLKVIEIGSDINRRAIAKYFENIAFDDMQDELKKLHSEKSRNLFKFLNVVSEYDLVSESFEITTMEEQFKKSLGRFSEMFSIPLVSLENVLPFRLKGKAIFREDNKATIEYGRLETLDENFLKFAKEQSQSNKIRFYSYEERASSRSQKELDRFWKLLYNSGVKKIKRKNDTDSPEYILEYINQELPEGEYQCNCLSCLYNRDDIDAFLRNINSVAEQNICRQSHSEIDLTQAYGFFKSGFVIKAFYALEELRSISWRKSEFIMYFLTCYNLKKLKPFVWYQNARLYKEVELKTIKQRIDKIDLNRILVELPVDNDVRETLRYLYREEWHESLSAEADRILSKLKDISIGYKKGGYHHSGPNYWYVLEHQIYDWRQFYLKNKLFDIDTLHFRKIVTKYVEVILLSFQISDEYSGKLVGGINYFFADASIMHVNSRDLKSLLEDYRIGNLEFYEHKKFTPILLKSYSRFIESGYVEHSYNRNYVEENDIYSIAIKNSNFFSNSMKRTFNNYLLLFAHIATSQEETDEILETSIKYLRVSNNFKFIDSLDFWEYFVVKRIKDFSIEKIELICEFLLSGKPNGFNAVSGICSAIYNTAGYENLLSESYAISMKKHFGKERFDGRNVLAFYQLLKSDSKKDFYKWLNNDLLHYSNELRIDAYWWGIWTAKKNPEVFESFSKSLVEEAGKYKDHEIDDNGNVVGLNSVVLWNDLVNFTHFSYRENLLEENEIKNVVKELKSQMFIWLLDPLNFDYSNFKMSWLNAFSGKVYWKKWSESKDLIKTLEENLMTNFHKNGSKVYFELKKLNQP